MDLPRSLKSFEQEIYKGNSSLILILVFENIFNSKYLLSAYYDPVTILDARKIGINKTDKIPELKDTFGQVGRSIYTGREVNR